MIQPDKYIEKELLQKVSEGDEQAFTQLFNQWKQLLAGYIFRITESKELTEEIVQDVFLKIWMTRETLVDVRNFKNYMIVVSRNQAFDILKKIIKQKNVHRIWEEETLKSIPTNQPEENKWNSLIDEAIDQLPARRKEVWLLSRHEHLTYQQIADRLGIGKESVKTHLLLASKSLTAFIKSRYPEALFIFIHFFQNI